LPLQPLFGLPTVTGKIGGRSVRLLIDTGSQFCLLRAEVVEELGLPVGPALRLSLLGKESTTLTTCVHNLTLGSVRAKHLPFVVSPGHLEQRLFGITIDRVDGVLGMPFLRRLVTTLDFPRRRVRFSDPAVSMPPSGRSVLAVPLAFLSDGRLCTAVNFGSERQYLFLLDTAARRCVLRNSVAEDLALTREGTVRLVSLGVSIKASFTTVPMLRVGPLRFSNVRAYVLPPGRNGMFRYTDGLLGISLFENSVLTIDPERRLLYYLRDIQPNRT